jgi:hypothetical protein
MTMWAARDCTGGLYLFKYRPKRKSSTFESILDQFPQRLNPNMLRYVTWENSPKKVKISIMEDE